MSDDHSAPALLREVGLMADGPVQWGRQVRHQAPGVFVVELQAPVPSAPLDLSLIGKWLERVPDLRLDGARPVSKDLQLRLNRFWLPSQPIVFIGSSTGSVSGRIAGIAKTVPGDRKPAWSGLWLHFLRNLEDLRIWWAATDATEEYEDALLDAFAAAVPASERAALHQPDPVLPWAVLRAASGTRKDTGITNPPITEVKAPEPPLVTVIVDLPPAEADGARDEARRGRRPAPGRGTAVSY